MYFLKLAINFFLNWQKKSINPGVMVKAMQYRSVVSEFEPQLRYFHFRANTLSKGINTFILPTMV